MKKPEKVKKDSATQPPPEDAPKFICATCAESILEDTHCYLFGRDTTPNTEACAGWKKRV